MEKTFEQYLKDAEQGNADAQYNLGFCYAFGKGVAKDETKPVYWYKKAAAQGNTDAQKRLGYCYAVGRGVAKDAMQAAYWYKKAAKHSNANLDNRNNLSKKVKCPKCFSENIERKEKSSAGNFLRGTSNLGRGLGFFPGLLIGAASELAGWVADSLSSSQECKKCGHKWKD